MHVMHVLMHAIVFTHGEHTPFDYKSNLTMVTFDPIHFIPASHQAQILDLPVTRILAVAHQNLGDTNHWCFYLSTSAIISVQLDCQPSHSIPGTVLEGGSKANLIMSKLDHVLPPDAETYFVLDVFSGVSVAHIYDTICEHGRHKYEFDSNGVGCRNWVMDQLELFSRTQLITSAAQVAEAKAGILKLWPDGTPNPLDKGAYYD
ncbi:hypothetical protein NUU61_007852 [Penicillium alfredii]|uniref:DUF7770 domain-containing protein n=1 Tax=Penicillium alfredii TaxID=1506179 RepID=A0A9W9ERI1_9EURO|nr:uncharacterized protein NUU61_007852 [Penicillium alfredii]KAJ5086545.1 hypothetical protein NUU61_007852 [Penicillium alfredii]